MTDPGLIRLPREIRFGWGSSSGIPRIVRDFGERVAIIADPFLTNGPWLMDTTERLRSLEISVLAVTDIPAELPVDSLTEIAARVADFRPDVLLAVGGGSTIDAAKTLAVLITHDDPPDAFYGENMVPGPVTPIIAVPTTAGTGSEVTPVAVVSDGSRELKVGISSPYLIPRVAVVDPEFTLAAPRSVTLYSGIDAFVHAVESFTTAHREHVLDSDPLPAFIGRNTLTAPFSLEAARLIFNALPDALADPSSRSAREDMSRGSLLAGIGFGATGTHLSHAIQYPIGALTHTPHGLGTGTLLPYVLQACAKEDPTRVAALGPAIGITASSDRAGAQAVVDAVASFCHQVGLPTSLRELGSGLDGKRDQIVDLSLTAARLVSLAPVVSTADTVGAVVDAALAGDREMLI